MSGRFDTSPLVVRRERADSPPSLLREFYAAHGRAPTLAEKIGLAQTLAELDDYRAGVDDLVAWCGPAFAMTREEKAAWVRRKAELARREAGRRR